MIKINKNVKSAYFPVISYIHFLVKSFFANITGDHNHVSRYMSNMFKLSGLNRCDKIRPSPNIPSLTVLLEKLSDRLRPYS